MSKIRNWVAQELRDLQGPYRPKVERNRKRYNRKRKHKNMDD